MKKQTEFIKRSIYEGMSIYGVLKPLDISIGEVSLSIEDKKHFCLYLGLNKLTEMDQSFNLKLDCVPLSLDEKLKMYEEDFIDIFRCINFDSLEGYLNYLYNIDVIKTIISSQKDGNKVLLKQI